LQVGEKNFRVQARVGEDDGLQIVFQKFLSHARGFIDVAAPKCQGRDSQRADCKKRKSFSAVGAPFELRTSTSVSSSREARFTGIGDGCGAADELRDPAVETRDAAKPPEHVAKMLPKTPR